MTSTSNGTAHHEAGPSVSRPSPPGQINAGGLSPAHEFSSLPAVSDQSRNPLEKQYLPGQPKSLSGIALRAFLLGFVLSTSVVLTFYLVLLTSSPLWRLPAFLATLSIFHFLEFWTTARYNTRSAQVSSFLLSQNGSAYNIAHTAAMLECLITNLIFPGRTWVTSSASPLLIMAGLVMTLVGQAVRSVAMIQAGTNFNHIVQHRKTNEHQLVTTGAYHYLRHPSYFGFFWWGLGTQLVLGNLACFLGYAIVLWRFFFRRISDEEELLIAFFGNEYVQYRKRTGVWIPFIR